MLTTFSNDEIIDQLTERNGQTRSWAGESVSYSMPSVAPTGTSEEESGFVTMTAKQAGFAKMAFELWDDLIALDLRRSGGTEADITMAFSDNTVDDGIYALVWTSPSTAENREIYRAQIWLNSDRQALTDANIDYQRGIQDMIHEVGHALGLRHPGDYDSYDSDEETAYEDDAEYAQDTLQYTAMSYFDAGLDGSGADHGKSLASTPLLHDIMAVQALYGADMTTRTGNTTYGFNSNAGRAVFDFEVNYGPVIAIWDAGGEDTLDVSGYSSNQRVYLESGVFSDVGGLRKNVAIAFGATIENAVGGRGNDRLTGNDADNRLTDNMGNDTLDGGRGSDLMIGGIGNDTYYVDTAARSGDVVVLVRSAATGGAGRFPWEDDPAPPQEVVGDRVVEYGGPGKDLIIASVSFTLPENVEYLTLNGTADLEGSGNSANNRIIGNGGDNVLRGFAGADIIDGKAGSDTMAGGSGNDTYYVNTATRWQDADAGSRALAAGDVTPAPVVPGDRVFESADEGQDLVLASVNAVVPVNVEMLTLIGTGDLAATGNSSANVINGNVGDNRLVGLGGADDLRGGSGDDTILGGAGADRMDGGRGKDVFAFNRSSDSPDGLGRDVITGFTSVEGDRIDLRSLDAYRGGGDDAFVFIGAVGFTAYKAAHAGDYGMARSVGGLVQIDIGGNGTVNMEIKVAGLTLHAFDFIL